jgi:small-conductance mechanosensitive channel
MSDQAQEQSIESRLMAFVDEENDAPLNLDAEEQPEVEAIETNPDEQAEEEVAEEEQAEEQSEEGEEEASEEEQPIKSLKLKVNGEEIEKPLEEVIALAQQGADYTQKTQQVAEQRKALEAQEQALQAQAQLLQQQAELQSALIGDVARLTAIDQQLEAYSKVNWQELSDNDFVEAQKLFFTYNQLQQQRGTIAQELEAKQTAMLQNKQQELAQKIEKGRELLAKEIPNWSRETSQAIITVGKDYGFTEEELSQVYDPRYVKVLHDAMQWRKLQSNPTVKNKVSQAKPVVKPGAKDAKVVESAQRKELRQTLRKTGKSEYATKLIEEML